MIFSTGEQPLADRETCCLGELVLPNIDSPEELWLCTQFIYRICKHSLLLPAPQIEGTEAIIRKHMRMGISVSGYLQAPAYKRDWLYANYVSLREFDVEYSKLMEVPTSIKLTTIKPAGTTGLITGVTPGLHPGFARYYLRRMRMSADSTVAAWCRAQGYNIEYEQVSLVSL